MMIYEALYNWMIEESSFATISTHKTEIGARNALAKYLIKEKEDFHKLYKHNVDKMPFRFGKYQAWRVSEIELLD